MGKIIQQKWSFFVLAMLVFIATAWLLGALGLLPSATTTPAVVVSSTPGVQPAVSNTVVEEPVKIEVKKIGLLAKINNPTVTDVPTLDRALLSGAVRYPTSASLGQDGNVILFGHSSYLPIVNNLAYKTFDGIQKLTQGDTITIYSSATAYTYAVDSVAKEDANSGGIPLEVSGRVLTLATCDSFGKKSDRFVVTAHFVESHPSVN